MQHTTKVIKGVTWQKEITEKRGRIKECIFLLKEVAKRLYQPLWLKTDFIANDRFLKQTLQRPTTT